MKIDLADANKVFWKSIPLSLIRDERLTYASRAVAIHLLSMSATWNFSATKLHEVLRVKSKDSEHLGRDSTKKIIKELEQHGYLVRRKKRLGNGVWKWFTSFHPLCGIPYLDEKFSKKIVNDEATIDGKSSNGEGVDKSGFQEEFLKKKTQQQKSPCTKTIEKSASLNDEQHEIANENKFESFELDLSHPMLHHHRSIFTKVSMKFSQSISPLIHQQIADEFAGVLSQIQAGNHGDIHSKRAWLLALFKSAKLDEFMPEFGPAIAKNRETQKVRKQSESNHYLRIENDIGLPQDQKETKKHLDNIKKILKFTSKKR
ncbi:hypothetical protein [Undibacterium sp. Di24W]|uniref:hypothetical protein n=1 Tax=Undibacterium sp. Di24W TaxID=3413033 RepID=UPI003BF1F81E